MGMVSTALVDKINGRLIVPCWWSVFRLVQRCSSSYRRLHRDLSSSFRAHEPSQAPARPHGRLGFSNASSHRLARSARGCNISAFIFLPTEAQRSNAIGYARADHVRYCRR